MKRGEIWLVDLPSSDGHEQTGMRPVIILVETEVNIAIIIPLTSTIQALRFPHTFEIKPSELNGLTYISVALIFQIRAIDKARLKKKIGSVEISILRELDLMLKKC